jgi:hypothetical protein
MVRDASQTRLLTMRDSAEIRSDDPLSYFQCAALIERSTASLGQQSTLSPADFW